MPAPTLRPQRPRPRPAPLAATIDRRLRVERLRDALLDAEIVVDDTRRKFEDVIGRLRAAVAARDTLARELQTTIAELEHAA